MSASTKAILAGVSVCVVVVIALVLLSDNYKSKRLAAARLGEEPPKPMNSILLGLVLLIFAAVIIFAIWSTYRRYKMADALLKTGNTMAAAAMFAPEVLGGLGIGRVRTPHL